jgi:hypothetical protein
MLLQTLDLTTVVFNRLKQPLKNISFGNSEATTNLTIKHRVQLYFFHATFSILLCWTFFRDSVFLYFNSNHALFYNNALRIDIIFPKSIDLLFSRLLILYVCSKLSYFKRTTGFSFQATVWRFGAIVSPFLIHIVSNIINYFCM